MNYLFKLLIYSSFISFILLFFSSSGIAQTDSIRIIEGKQRIENFDSVHCVNQEVLAISNVIFNDKSSVVIRLKYLGYPMNKLDIVDNDKQIEFSVNENGVIILENLPLDRSYFILAEDNCGQKNNIARFSTNLNNNKMDNGIVMLDPFIYKRIRAYGYDEATLEARESLSFTDYLFEPQLSKLHYLESLSLFQRLFLDGKPINNEFASNISTEIIENLRNSEMIPACSCSPIGMTARNEPVNGKTCTDKCLWNDAYQYNTYGCSGGGSGLTDVSSKGAAKYLEHDSKGWKEKCWETCKRFHDGSAFQDTVSMQMPYQTSVRMSLLCLNGEFFPENCECDKNIFAEYYYGSFVEANATVPSNGGGTCGNAKRAEGYIRDVAIISSSKTSMIGPPVPSEINILDMVSNSAVSTCNIGMDTSLLFEEYLDIYKLVYDSLVLGDVIRLLDPTDGIDLDELADMFPWTFGDYLDEVADVIKIIAGAFKTSCESATNTLSTDNVTSMVLEPNTEVKFEIRSGTGSYSAGRKSWDINLKSTSAAYIVAKLLPGFYSEEEQNSACCSNYGAIFNGGAYDRPIHSGNLWTNMGSFLTLPPNMTDCRINDISKGDIGWCTKPLDFGNCVINPSGGDRSSHANQFSAWGDREIQINKFSIYNLSGQLLGDYQGIFEYSSINDFTNTIRVNNLANYPKGLYLLRYQSTSDAGTLKLLNY